jgi:signal transduction histidine kinase
MKFTFKGYIKLKVELIKIQDCDAVKVSIIDTGCGISESE